jgi:hypothetical protein
MYSNKKPLKVETGKPAKQIYPTPKVYPPTPLLENENPPAPALPIKTKVKLPANLAKEQKFSFWQEMLVRMMPLSDEIKTGKISKISLSYEKGCFVMRTVYA